MSPPGRVVILDGTASAGKTSLATAIQMAAATMWVVVAQDDFARNLIPRFVGLTEAEQVPATPSDGFTFVRAGDGTTTVDVGPVDRRLLRG
jgi:chloramphenicol 3-O phosphotransferase